MNTLHNLMLRRVDEDGNLPSHASGGYPVLYLDSDNDVLCAECATDALHNDEVQDRFKPVGLFQHLEGEAEFCSECNKMVESAYGIQD